MNEEKLSDLFWVLRGLEFKVSEIAEIAYGDEIEE
jgi:hypothetical protein